MKKTKENNKKGNSVISSDNEMTKLLLFVLIVVLVFVAVYIITIFVTKEDDDIVNESTDDYTVNIQYDKILATDIFSQSASEYYVLVYFEEDGYVDFYKNYLMYYSTFDNSVPYYYVNVDEVFNKEFIGDKSILNVTNANDFKFSQTVLLRIKDKKVISTYEGKDNIAGKLGRMTK